jgi:hypothetical protein
VQRYTRGRDTGANAGTGTRYIHHDEIVFCTVPAYDPNSYAIVYASGNPDPRTFTSTVTNKTQVDAECDFYLDAAMAEYQQTEAVQLTYGGIRGDIDLDGAIQHLSYSVGPPYATTSAARNSEVLSKVRSYKEMRMIENTRAAILAGKRINQAVKASAAKARNAPAGFRG